MALDTVTISGSVFPNALKNTGLPLVDLVLPAQTSFGPLSIDTLIEEVHESDLEMTENPVEAGAQITDHSFLRPLRVRLSCGWSNSSLQALKAIVTGVFSSSAVMSAASDYVQMVYGTLTKIQASRQPITVATTLVPSYQNMLITSISVRRDKRTSQAIMVEAECRQAIIVSTQTALLPALANQKTPASTGQVSSVGTKQLVSGNPSPGGSLPPTQWVSMVPSAPAPR